MISRLTGQQSGEPSERPLLQGLGQQRVIRVGQCPPRQIPGLVPAKLRLVEQNSHQFGDRHRRMRVVELDRRLLGEQAPVGVGPAKTAHEIGQRAGDQEVLLNEAQTLALACRIIRIKNARERLG